ncbi:aryl-sulfate sulfotransferase [Solidesulfovibrio carbinolicus]|uniref:Arylsulfotransferase (ASST) n=1 Tax=Solidesulfovibrio carbinolicus TaxID=296842 RepID=A0A4P6HNZ8_9BACT|nr:aryl-sulfate sulfotransferase [Solidesulfovibrio carbinolicus]QAZ68805.1 arylsulfotransferase (ASST) [Solidesulfovibrio carbinolicus]
MTTGNAQEQTVGLFTADVAAQPGLTLVATLFGHDTWLLDNAGQVVNSWTSPHVGAGAAYLLGNGDLVRSAVAYRNAHVGKMSAPAGGLIEEFDWEGNLVWSYKYIGEDYSQHHDFCVMPNGNLLLVAWEYKSPQEAYLAGRSPAFIPTKGLLVDSVVEVQKTGPNSGQIVWEWHAWDHLVQDENPALPDYGQVSSHPERININSLGALVKETGKVDSDWTHINGIDYNAQTDQIMLSVHTQSEVWIIDHGTTTAEAAGSTGGKAGHGGDLLYRFGNPRAYDAGTLADQTLYGQHDALWIESGLPGAGNVLVFNNGWQSPYGEYSHVLELVLPVDEDGAYRRDPDGSFAEPEVVWRYPDGDVAGFYSAYVSGAQRVENGDTLVTLGATGTLMEITPAGETVWSYVNPDTDQGLLQQGESAEAVGLGYANNVFRATRYAYDFEGFAGKNLVGGNLLVADPSATAWAVAGQTGAGATLGVAAV